MSMTQELSKILSEGLPQKHEITVELLQLEGWGFAVLPLKTIYVGAHLSVDQAAETVEALRKHFEAGLPIRWVDSKSLGA